MDTPYISDEVKQILKGQIGPVGRSWPLSPYASMNFATLADKHALLCLHRSALVGRTGRSPESCEQAWDHFFNPECSNGHYVLQVKGSGQTVAFIMYGPTATDEINFSKTEAEIQYLETSPEGHAKGYRRALLAHACEELCQRGFEKMSVPLSKDNGAMQEFFTRHFTELLPTNPKAKRVTFSLNHPLRSQQHLKAIPA